MKGLRTLVIGASPNPERYSYKAVMKLIEHGHEPIGIGVKDGRIGNLTILKGMPRIEGVNTVSLYIGPERQPEYYDYIIGLKPKRLIMNPGTENPEFARKAEKSGIEVVEACTLVLLATGQYEY